MHSRYKAIGFDMDGTLLNTKVDLMKMANVIFDEMVREGIPESVIKRKEGFKHNLDTAKKYLEDNGRPNDIYRIYERAEGATKDVEMENVRLARPFPGSIELIYNLKEKGYKVGVLTRGCREYAETALNISGALKLMDALVCRDDFPEEESKPSPKAMFNFAHELNVNVSDILYLGDHKFDYFSANGAGAGFVGVMTGGYTMDDWKKVDPNIKVIPTVADLDVNI